MRHAIARVALVAAIAAAAVAASSAPAAAQGNSWLDPEQFGIESFTTASSDMQAGGHPDVSTSFEFSHELYPNAFPFLPDEPWTYGRGERMEFDLPAGLVGDPTAFETCPVDRFLSEVPCPPRSQVGITDILATGFFGQKFENSGVFNLEHGPDEPVLLGVKPASSLFAFIKVRVNPDGTLTAIADELVIAHALVLSDFMLWGVPADSSHDLVRGTCASTDVDGNGNFVDDDACPTDAPLVPFISGPTECDTIPTTTLRAYSYEGKAATASHSLDTPQTNCQRVPFDPKMSATPSSRVAGAPTGLDVQIRVPQNQLPNGVAAAHVRSVRIALPEGMRVSPSSANGLGACSPADFGYRTDSAITCPDSSKIGSLSVQTPLLDESMQGSVYLAKQNDNPFNSLLALYIAVEGSGVQIKLAGRVDPDPVTGRLTTTFEDNPQLPFEQLDLSLKSGPRAPLVNPVDCGTYQSETQISAWTKKVVSASAPMTIDQGCAPLGFAPSFEAGSTNPVAGRSSAFAMSLSRGDRDRELREVSVSMPKGLLGAIATADQCPAAQADAGTCGTGSRIGAVTTAAGAGSSPFRLPGDVHLTGTYKGAPFGLSFVVPAVAGPFDLGTVVVRAAVHVDRRTAAVRVVSDPLPTILKGIPTQIRSVEVTVDRPGFMLNPTDCTPTQVSGRIAAAAAGSPVSVGSNEIGYATQSGQTSDVSSRFQVGDCQALRFKPRLGLRLTGRRQIRTGRHPGVRAVVRQSGVGEAAIRRARVVLPKSLALDPENAQALCEFEDGTKPDLESHCPKGSIVGRARAKTPLLDRDLVGDVYFVKNVRIDKRTGNEIRTLPMIVVALRGEIAINLTGKSSTAKDGRLVNTFASVPDAPIGRFNLNIRGGGNGILAVTRTRRAKINLCAKPKSHVADTDWRGQNGKRADYDVRVKTPCRAKKKAS